MASPPVSPAEWQLQRARKIFNFLDTDNNGYLSKNDYLQMAKRITTRLGVKSEKKVEQIKNTWLSYWEPLQGIADKNGDNIVTWEEYEPATHKVFLDDHFFNTYVGRDYTDIVINGLDVDNSGCINKTEFCAQQTVFGVDQAEAEKRFELLDFKHTGTLTRDEVTAHLRNIYRNDDPICASLFLFPGLIEIKAEEARPYYSSMLIFTQYWTHRATKDLKKGDTFIIKFCRKRLPQVDQYKGGHIVNIFAGCNLILSNGSIISKQLDIFHWNKIGEGPPRETSYYTKPVVIPKSTVKIELWFFNSTPIKTYWDSNYGKNYTFNVV